jgi:anthranilate phosphoribosyltransferase
MSNAFRELLKKVGSGTHTHKDLTREEAADATRMMLLNEATPAQIGAFMIAHRIKRPTGTEMAGMLDAYTETGPQITYKGTYTQTPVVFGIPYDGRSRTAPLTPLTAIVLCAAGIPIIMHGGDRMPTKYGISLAEIWQGLGVDWTNLSLEQVEKVFDATGIAFVYTPKHFPSAASLTPYRDQIGKRPPFATLELIWHPYAGEAHLISGFVHPPTEKTIIEALSQRDTPKTFTTVKGLEGSCDLPRDRTAIIGMVKPDNAWERLLLSHRDYGFSSYNVPLNSSEELVADLHSVLHQKDSELRQSILWNAGFYLWHLGICEDLKAGCQTVQSLIDEGKAEKKLGDIRTALRE